MKTIIKRIIFAMLVLSFSLISSSCSGLSAREKLEEAKSKERAERFDENRKRLDELMKKKRRDRFLSGRYPLEFGDRLDKTRKRLDELLEKKRRDEFFDDYEILIIRKNDL